MLDLVEELRLRRWARENYVPLEDRSTAWHAVIHDEMTRRDQELSTAPECRRKHIVPLMPQHLLANGPQLMHRPLVLAPTAGASSDAFVG